MRVSKNKAIAAIFTMALATGTLFGCSQSDQAASDNQSSQSQNTASETQGAMHKIRPMSFLPVC